MVPQAHRVFIHRSIKTRIETSRSLIASSVIFSFLYIDPLKQGLKLVARYHADAEDRVFIHRSIKTRIETISDSEISYFSASVFIHRSIKTRIETDCVLCASEGNSMVFIHRSIKTRIETFLLPSRKSCKRGFYT